MPRHLKTAYKRIGRSGPTVDGRNIDPDDMRQAAETYNREVYTALIWPGHSRWFNLGKVEQVRIEDNDEGGVDLYAVSQPNDIYLQINKADQLLFSSMELTENFRGTGKTYLTGLGATDNPASAATEEQRFSKESEKNVKVSAYVESTTHYFEDEQTDYDQPPSWFKNLFSKTNQSESDMDKETLAAMQTQLASLTENFNSLSALIKPAGDDKPAEKTDAEKFTALSDLVESLTTKFTAMEEKLAGEGTDDDDKEKQYTELKIALDELTEKFKAATKEQGGTEAGEETGSDDLSGCL